MPETIQENEYLELLDDKTAWQRRALGAEQEVKRLRALCDRLLKESAERDAIRGGE